MVMERRGVSADGVSNEFLVAGTQKIVITEEKTDGGCCRNRGRGQLNVRGNQGDPSGEGNQPWQGEEKGNGAKCSEAGEERKMERREEGTLRKS